MHSAYLRATHSNSHALLLDLTDSYCRNNLSRRVLKVALGSLFEYAQMEDFRSNGSSTVTGRGTGVVHSGRVRNVMRFVALLLHS